MKLDSERSLHHTHVHNIINIACQSYLSNSVVKINDLLKPTIRSSIYNYVKDIKSIFNSKAIQG